ncbi:ABC transporter permease [Clostridium thermosuccinogenes]|uniref:ABC transporter permease n=1 Tax=Clostridium thermosuccinogenes TaxID=84032 RepID=UPI000CCBF27A|nr:FtsX-like permease family protein [Pseudoclostridium thermosuccinogenes]PNT92541.1 hypothetical protein CDQ83_02955 [Pseudoclostridium thermosuccinogenes]
MVSFLKRTVLYLTRKKGKTLILLLLIFIVTAFVLTCFSVLYTTQAVSKSLRTSVGAAFHIRSSMDFSFNGSKIDTENDEQAVITDMAIQQIMENEEIKYYNARNFAYAKSRQIRFIPGTGHTDENNMGGLSANTYSALHPYFTDKILELSEGRHITPDDENCIIISEELARINQLSVGDKILLAPAEFEQEDDVFIDTLKDSPYSAEVEIVGFFRILKPQEDAAYQPTAGLRSNLMITDHHTLVALNRMQAGVYTGGVSFYLSDPIHLDSIVRKVKHLTSIDWDSYFILNDDFNYEKIAAGLNTIQNLIRILLVCICLVSAAVLLLILAMRMRGRVHEAGVLLSIGYSRKEIVGQFIAEVLLTAFLAFVGAYFLAVAVAGGINKGIVENIQIVQVEGQPVKSTQNLTLALPADISLVIFICILATLFCAVFLSSSMIIRLKPREILSKMA